MLISDISDRPSLRGELKRHVGAWEEELVRLEWNMNRECIFSSFDSWILPWANRAAHSCRHVKTHSFILCLQSFFGYNMSTSDTILSMCKSVTEHKSLQQYSKLSESCYHQTFFFLQCKVKYLAYRYWTWPSAHVWVAMHCDLRAEGNIYFWDTCSPGYEVFQGRRLWVCRLLFPADFTVTRKMWEFAPCRSSFPLALSHFTHCTSMSFQLEWNKK